MAPVAPVASVISSSPSGSSNKWIQWCASVVAQAVPKRNLRKMCFVNIYIHQKLKRNGGAKKRNIIFPERRKKKKNSICNVQNVFIYFSVGLGYNYAYNNAYTTGKHILKKGGIMVPEAEMSRFWY